MASSKVNFNEDFIRVGKTTMRMKCVNLPYMFHPSYHNRDDRSAAENGLASKFEISDEVINTSL